MRKSRCDGSLDALHRDGFYFHSTCPHFSYILEYANILIVETKKIHNFSMSNSLVPISGYLLNNSEDTLSSLGIYKARSQRLLKLGSKLFQAILVKQVMHR